MKDYEIYSNLRIPKSSEIILRLDGRKFHTLSHKLNLEKPYDFNFSSLMVEISKDIFNEFSPKFVYTFSDEINIWLSEIPFSGRIEKLNSVFSSIASSSFIYHFTQDFSSKMDFKELSNITSIMPVSFDSRVIPISKEKIYDYFKWRQDESWRNCINSYGIWVLNQEYSTEIANNKIKGLKSRDIHQLLFERGINLNNIDKWKRRGIGIYKKSYEIEGFNPIKNKKTYSIRQKLFVDWSLELFNKEFFENFY